MQCVGYPDMGGKLIDAPSPEPPSLEELPSRFQSVHLGQALTIESRSDPPNSRNCARVSRQAKQEAILAPFGGFLRWSGIK